MMSSRTLGTSAKKKRAKKPAAPPNPAARTPLQCVSRGFWACRECLSDILLCSCADGDAVVVLRNGVSVVVALASRAASELMNMPAGVCLDVLLLRVFCV
jgi:hypothetical protein